MSSAEGAPVRLGSSSFRHGHVIAGVAFLPGAPRLVTGSYDGSVKLWDAATGAELKRILAHSNGVSAVAAAPQGDRLASGGFDGRVVIHDLESGLVLAEWRAGDQAIGCLAWSPDGTRVMVGASDGIVRIFDPSAGEVGRLVGHSHAVNSVRPSRDGTRIATGSWDGTVRLWDLASATEQLRLEGHGGWLQSLDLAPDGAVVAWGRGREVVLTPTGGGPERAFLGHSREVCGLAFSPQGEALISVGFDHEVRRWDLATGTESGIFRGAPGAVYQVAFSPDGGELAVAGASALSRLALPAMTPLSAGVGHRAEVRSLAWLAGERLASAGADGEVRIWDLGPGQASQALRPERDAGLATCLAASPDGNQLVAGYGDRRLRFWDPNTGTPGAVWEGHDDDVTAVAWSASGAVVASGARDGRVLLRGTEDGGVLHQLSAHQRGVAALAFSPNGRVLGTLGRDRYLRLWDAAGGKSLLRIEADTKGATCLAFAPDGSWLVTGGSDGRVCRWRLSDGALEREYPGLEGWVFTVAVSADGLRVAAAGEEGAASVWSAPDAGVISRHEGHEGWIYAAAYAPDGRLATGGSDTSVRVWC